MAERLVPDEKKSDWKSRFFKIAAVLVAAGVTIGVLSNL